jgi:hypothetical protein
MPAGRLLLIANAFAYSLGLIDEIVEEAPNVARDVLDRREDLFKDIAHQVRRWDPQIICQSPDVL